MSREIPDIRCGSASRFGKARTVIDKPGSTLLTEGNELGGCRVIRPIGKGGMGEVYLARHLLLDKQVAIKVLPPSKIDDEHVARFIREAQTCSKIDHPNVVTIHNIDRSDGSYFIVMQFVDGKNLAEIVKTQGGPIPWRTALKIMRHAARGVEAVHDKGLLHRDIKPSNIMVGNNSQVVLMDFGLVREEAESDLTATGAILGTPIYMAPEQCTGEELDKRCDVYALGATLYFLLTGKHPFEGSVRTVLMQKAAGQRPPAPHIVNRFVPADVSQLVERAMDFRVQSRIPDAKTFGRELQRLLKDSDDAEGSSVETSRMSALKTAGHPPTGEEEIVPELEPIRNIATLAGGDTLRRVLPWAFAAGGVMLLAAIGLLLNSYFGNKAGRKSENGSRAGNGSQKPGGGADHGKKAAKKGTPVDTKTMVFIPAGEVQIGNRADEIRANLDRAIEWAVRSEIEIARTKGTPLTDGQIDNLRQNRKSYFEAQLKSQSFDPTERVKVDEFWIDRYEVTNQAYAEFVAKTGHRAPAYWVDKVPPRGREGEPVSQVTYDDAAAYAKWAGKQLPTLAQWVRAYRGDKDSMFPWGNLINDGWACTSENPKYKSANGPCSVGDTPMDRSVFGVCNMVGNVREIVRETPVIDGHRSVIFKGGYWSYFGNIRGIAPVRYTYAISQFDFVIDAEAKSRRFSYMSGFRCVYEPESKRDSPKADQKSH
jgi:formylglycine-generating enzyme required for sulfatase activity/tRNA A-37 threonylcarbamoyl transferase component Bud32